MFVMVMVVLSCGLSWWKIFMIENGEFVILFDIFDIYVRDGDGALIMRFVILFNICL